MKLAIAAFCTRADRLASADRTMNAQAVRVTNSERDPTLKVCGMAWALRRATRRREPRRPAQQPEGIAWGVTLFGPARIPIIGGAVTPEPYGHDPCRHMRCAAD